MRNLVIVLGDQLTVDSSAFEEFDPKQDAVWMAEVAGEATHVWSHQARIALFLSGMRHFRDELRRRDKRVLYRQLDDPENQGSLEAELIAAIQEHQPDKLILTEPGAYRICESLKKIAKDEEVPLEIRPDNHFICSHEEFQEHAKGRKQLRLEYFYREWRKKLGILMEDGEPVGGSWNYDSENRGSFAKEGPEAIKAPRSFRPDEITEEVLQLVKEHFGDHPGELEHFDWPVTRKQALAALRDFLKYRLPKFGNYQDAMWTDRPWLYHSRISAALNLKLLNPREVIEKAEAAYHAKEAPLNAVEGFIRQILGWREYVRAIYWWKMPDYLDMNALDAKEPLPDFYWTGETNMQCLQQSIGQTLKHGYAHHIQRLMVTGLYALILGVNPKEVHEWYLAVYVDAVEWVELPNTLGMSQFGDGGIMASKPYAATGKYIQRMSNYCQGCQFDPAEATGETACPFTTLYWDFLDRHRERLSKNQRMSLQLKNLERKSEEELQQIRKQAKAIRENPAFDGTGSGQLF